MDVREAARRLEVSPKTVYQLVARRQLGHYRVGAGRGAIRISEDQLAAYRAACEVPVEAGLRTSAPTPDAGHPLIPDYIGSVLARRLGRRA